MQHRAAPTLASAAARSHSTAVTRTAEPDDARAPCGWSRTLLAGFRAGTPEALREVYRMHAREITTMLRHGFAFDSAAGVGRFAGLSSPFELQDALHETFARAFEPAARTAFDGIRPYGPYLRTIARNVVLRAGRRQRERVPLQDVADDGRAPVGAAEDAADPERAAQDGELVALVRAFLERVPAPDRALLQARFVDGLSQRDAAAQLGLGRQQLRTREARLREALLEHLRERGRDGLAAVLPSLLATLVVEALR